MTWSQTTIISYAFERKKYRLCTCVRIIGSPKRRNQDNNIIVFSFYFEYERRDKINKRYKHVLCGLNIIFTITSVYVWRRENINKSKINCVKVYDKRLVFKCWSSTIFQCIKVYGSCFPHIRKPNHTHLYVILTTEHITRKCH